MKFVNMAQNYSFVMSHHLIYRRDLNLLYNLLIMISLQKSIYWLSLIKNFDP